MAKMGIKEGLKYGKSIPGTLGIVSSGLDAVYDQLIK